MRQFLTFAPSPRNGEDRPDGKQMVPAPYVNLMAEALMAVRDGAGKRLIFNLPPGHMKSLIISVLFSAWLLGVEPSKRILCVSYGDDLTRQLSRLTRRVMISPLYRRIFPKTILAKQAEDLLTTTKGGQRLATAVGGTIAGGAEANGCSVDPAAIADAARLLERALATNPDLLVVNRFGRLESEGGGMLAEIGRAFAEGVAVILRAEAL